MDQFVRKTSPKRWEEKTSNVMKNKRKGISGKVHHHVQGCGKDLELVRPRKLEDPVQLRDSSRCREEGHEARSEGLMSQVKKHGGQSPEWDSMSVASGPAELPDLHFEKITQATG